MKLLTISASAFLLLSTQVFANNCDIEPHTTGPKINEITGVVLDSETRKGISEVKITVYNSSKKETSIKTDESGKFSFDELKSGIYKLVFEKEGYQKLTKEKISIKEDETLDINIEMILGPEFILLNSPFMIFD